MNPLSGLTQASASPVVAACRLLLFWLSAIFALRVVLQFVLQFTTLHFLPGFELWHSATMPYAVLLAFQLLILGLMLLGAVRVPFRKRWPRLGSVLFWLAWLYIALMVGRLFIGAFAGDATAGLPEKNSWFDGVVSTAFHFGLAAYLLVFALLLRGVSGNRMIEGTLMTDADTTASARHGRAGRVLMLASYPCIIVCSYLLFFRLTETGSPLMFSAYLSVLAGVTAVLIHETLQPCREDWRPHIEEIFSDGLFLLFVQIGLPAILKVMVLGAIVWAADNSFFAVVKVWPVNAPVLLQVAMMLLVAEFFRYWIHRSSHHYKVLWKLHAVHHASTKLYTVNVGRFHPLDKSLQFLGDTLPFLLLGVAPEVFAAYFVFYAVNGFFQHSNAEVRLGWLNRVIAGPELHRWHHSAKVQEAKCNFGNNLIVWDSVFGTRYLPASAASTGKNGNAGYTDNRHPEKIGIGNPQWPTRFLPQLIAPFTTPTEATPTGAIPTGAQPRNRPD